MSTESFTTPKIDDLVNRLSKYCHDSEDIPSWEVEEIDDRLDAILIAVREHIQATTVTDESILLDTIAEEIRKAAPSARFVVADTSEWDNGYFLVLSTVTVVDADGHSDEVEVDLANWEADLTDELGPLGHDSAFVLDLATLKYELTNTYGVDAAIVALGGKVPPEDEALDPSLDDHGAPDSDGFGYD